MAVIHIVSHTHWDREWYLTFQQYRVKLVRLIDKLLSILHDNPDYKYFLLDGQTVVLQDYLEIRPERKQELINYIRGGRIFIGPWYCLPDEFLVSPESLVRNLLAGRDDASEFGDCMGIGYVPDMFAHVGQLPQIFAGFSFKSCVAWRGLGDQPCELWWESPDGSRVLLAHLREIYSNAVKIPGLTEDATVLETTRQLDRLEPYSGSGHLLFMNGHDHVEPRPEITGAITLLNTALPRHRFVHSNLPAYFQSMFTKISQADWGIPILKGELRDSRRHPSLTGTRTTHIWIKQRNHACETLLEKWAEPLCAYSRHLGSYNATMNWQPFVSLAWRLLLQCHPHDSICGSSIDQVIEEMKPRFDQAEQIGSEVTRLAIDAVTTSLDMQCPDKDNMEPIAVTVFNPSSLPASDAVEISVILDDADTWIEISDENSRLLPCQLTKRGPSVELMEQTLDWDGLVVLADAAMETSSHGITPNNMILKRTGDELDMNFVMDNTGSLVMKNWEEEVGKYLTDTSLKAFNVRADLVRPSTIIFTAENVPANGYRTFWLRKIKARAPLAKFRKASHIENEFFSVQADESNGLLKITDKRTGATYNKLNRFLDTGDCGDLYNYCPPARDLVVDSQKDARVRSIKVLNGAVSQCLEIALSLPVPQSLANDRQSRSEKTVDMLITTLVTLTHGVERVDMATKISNRSSDHRLSVNFAAPFKVTHADYDGHFEVVNRPVGLPEFDDTWCEQPLPVHPQRNFTDISDGKLGLMIASRGLREAGVINSSNFSEITLTLLRCTGILSLDNLSTRKSHAGPPFLATPAAQMHGDYSFEYSIIPHTGTWQHAFNQASNFNAPMKAVISLPHKGEYPGTGSFIQSKPETFVITAIKNAQDFNGLIVRGYNITSERIDLSVKPIFAFKSAQKCRMDETITDDLKPDSDGSVKLQAKAHEIVTLKFMC